MDLLITHKRKSIQELKAIRRIANIQRHLQSFHYAPNKFKQVYISVFLIEGHIRWIINQVKSKNKLGVVTVGEKQEDNKKEQRLNKIEDLLKSYYNSEDSFEQNDLAINLIQGHMGWLIEQVKK